MGQSKMLKMSQSSTSLDAMCDEAELQLINLRLSPTRTARYCCRNLCCSDAPLTTRAPFHSEESSDSEYSTTSCGPSESPRTWKEKQECCQTVRFAEDALHTKNAVSSDVKITNLGKGAPDSMVSTTTLSLMCEGRTNGKKWELHISSINEGISGAELRSMMESMHRAIASTFPPQHQTVGNQADADQRLGHDQALADETTISVVSRDSGLPAELEIGFPPPYRSPCKMTCVTTATEQTTVIVAPHGNGNDRVSSDGDSPARQHDASSCQRTAQEHRAPKQPSQRHHHHHHHHHQQSAASEQHRRQHHQPHDDHDHEQDCHASSARHPPLCTNCTRRLKSWKRRREQSRAKPAHDRQHRQSLTVASVGQDVIEEYLTLKFRSASEDELCDAKSLTFSEYMGGGDQQHGGGQRDGRDGQAAAHRPRRRRRHRGEAHV